MVSHKIKRKGNILKEPIKKKETTQKRYRRKNKTKKTD